MLEDDPKKLQVNGLLSFLQVNTRKIWILQGGTGIYKCLGGAGPKISWEPQVYYEEEAIKHLTVLGYAFAHDK